MLILTILKIIGIALLVILGIIFLLICIAVFVPVRYKADGTYIENTANISMRATWLMHFISAKFGYDGKGQPHITVKLLFFSLFDNLVEKAPKNKKVKKAKNKSKKEKSSEESASRKSDEEIQAASIPPKAPDDVEVSAKASVASIDSTSDSGMEATPQAENEAASESIIQKIGKTFKKLIDFVQNMKYTFQKICDTIASIRSNIEYYINLLRQDSTKAAFFKCKGELLKIFKSLAPKKFQVNLHLGFDNPATLGDIMAIWGMLYPFHQGRIDIVPEFEQSVIEGDFSLKGRISLFIFVRAAAAMFFDKNIRSLLRQFKR